MTTLNVIQPIGEALMALIMACQINAAGIESTPKQVLTEQKKCVKQVVHCYHRRLRDSNEYYNPNFQFDKAISCLLDHY